MNSINEKEQSTSKALIYSLIGFGAIVAITLFGLLISGSLQNPDSESYPVSYSLRGPLTGNLSEQGVDAVTIRVHDGEGETDFYPVEFTAGASAYEHMLKLAEQNDDVSFEYEGNGETIFITGINGKSFAEGERMYWQVLLNGTPTELGVAQTEVAKGDVLEFIPTTY